MEWNNIDFEIYVFTSFKTFRFHVQNYTYVLKNKWNVDSQIGLNRDFTLVSDRKQDVYGENRECYIIKS